MSLRGDGWKKQPSSHLLCLWSGGGAGGKSAGWYKNKSCLWIWTSSGLHASPCACAHMCTLRGWHVHYLFISPVCRAATLCISACLTIIMPHALFNTHADSDADSCRDIYLRYAHLSPGTLLSQTGKEVFLISRPRAHLFSTLNRLSEANFSHEKSLQIHFFLVTKSSYLSLFWN